MYSSRAGSVMGTTPRRDTERSAPRHDIESSSTRRDREPLSARRDSDSVMVRNEGERAAPRIGNERKTQEPSAVGTGIQPRQPTRPTQEEQPAAEQRIEPAVPAVSGLSPIHQRLSTFRQSMFSQSGDKAAATASDSKTAPAAADKPDQPAMEPMSRDRVEPEEAAAKPAVENPPVENPPVEPPPVEKSAVEKLVVENPAVEKPAAERHPMEGQPTLAPPASAGIRQSKPAEDPIPRSGVIPDSPPRSAVTRSPTDATENDRALDRSSDTRTASQSGGSMFSAESAALSIETSGPRKIVVGKEGTYEVVLRNRSVVAAEQVTVSIDLPQWTEVAGADATAGTVAPGQDSGQARQVRWLLPRLSAQRSEKLSLRIVPRQSKPFGLTPKVDIAPPPSQAVIEVQEAKLALALHGPREVLFGKPETYKLEISNTGTADAENVAVSLTSNASGEKLATATQRFGTLAAGRKKTVTMELTARQEGTLSVAIDALADGGAKAQLAEAIAVRRAKLKAEVEAPKVAYSGNEVTYRIRLHNHGNAVATNVKVQAALPRGAKYVSSLQNGRPSADGKVHWAIERLNVGGDAALGLTCVLAGDGSGRLDLQCDADGDAGATASAVTQVETAPNLVLTVEEPSGPVGLDGEATYKVHLQNRGTAGAEAVEVVVYFAKNLEPVSAEGARHKIGSGQVAFDAIPALAPGQTSTFQVKAKADKTGNHIFRVEVHASATGIRLVREGTTRFYATDAAAGTTAIAKPTGQESPGAAREIRTADRRDSAAGGSRK
jgi:uncharacterized repeat protein (TIGR01451 family)